MCHEKSAKNGLICWTRAGRIYETP